MAICIVILEEIHMCLRCSDVSACAICALVCMHWMEATDFSASAQADLDIQQPATGTPPHALQGTLGVTVSALLWGSQGGGRKREKRDCDVPKHHHNHAAARDMFFLTSFCCALCEPKWISKRVSDVCAYHV